MNNIFCLFFLFIANTIWAINPIIVLLGPPGSGKGTFAQFFKQNFGYEHLSTGDIIRHEIEKKSEFGLKIAEIVRRGDYIDQEIIHSIMAKNIYELHSKNIPFIIDGFERSIEDVYFLYNLLNSMHVSDRVFAVLLDAEDEVCKKRIEHRVVCPQCKHVYNTIFYPSPFNNQCALCFNTLKIRINDTPEVIEKRILDYRKNVEQCHLLSISFYSHIIYQTTHDINECFQYYSQLEKHINKILTDQAISEILLIDPTLQLAR